MTKAQAYRLAIRALVDARHRIATDAKLYTDYGARYPQAMAAHKLYAQYTAAITMLNGEMKK